MRSLEELKSIEDGGSFDVLVNKAKKAANGNRLLKLDKLTEYVVTGFVRKAMERKRLADEAFRKETNINNGIQFRYLNFKIPKKSRSRVPVPAIVQEAVSNLESKNSSSMKRGFVEVEEDEGIDKKPLVKKPDTAFRNETNINNGIQFRFLNFKIPKKTRSRVPVPAMVQDAVSKLESKNSSSMKRGFVEEEEEDEEIEKKQREADHNSLEKVKKKKKETTIKQTNLDDQRLLDPVIPQDFQEEINKLNGTDVMLVGVKQMTLTDMDTHQGRFSIPRGKVINDDFLQKEENPKEGVKCSLIQPCLQVIKDLEFKKWTMNKTFSYTLIKKWNSVTYNEKNELHKDCLVQLWSFRVGSNLWFALVNLDLKQKHKQK